MRKAIDRSRKTPLDQIEEENRSLQHSQYITFLKRESTHFSRCSFGPQKDPGTNEAKKTDNNQRGEQPQNSYEFWKN